MGQRAAAPTSSCQTARVAFVLALFLIVGALGSGALAAPPSSLSDDQQRRLWAGEVILVDTLPPGAGRSTQGGTAIAIVHAPPETVWRILVDYRGHSTIYPRVVGTEVLEADEHKALVRYVVGIGPFSFHVYMNKYLDATRRRVEWRLADEHPNGLFRESSGYWQVDPAEGASRLTYALAVRTILPAFATHRAQRDSLVETVLAVRKRAEDASRAAVAR
jgi:ribosome-associated toxin RatA of RatAB toxin-antitoxin module